MTPPPRGCRAALALKSGSSQPVAVSQQLDCKRVHLWHRDVMNHRHPTPEEKQLGAGGKLPTAVPACRGCAAVQLRLVAGARVDENVTTARDYPHTPPFTIVHITITVTIYHHHRHLTTIAPDGGGALAHTF